MSYASAERITFRHGCTKAAIGAIVLDKMLRQPSCYETTYIPTGFSRNFFKEQSVKVAGAWDFTKCIGIAILVSAY